MKTLHSYLAAAWIVALSALVAGCVTGTTPEDAGLIFPDAHQPDSGPEPVDAGEDPPPECTPEGMGSTIGESCTRDAECDDACFCNGRELCVEGTCAVGGPACPGSACATATCDEAEDRCSLSGDDTQCDDANPCNGVERCDVRTGCRSGAPPTCNDADTCTIDYCDPAVGCVYEMFDGDGDGAHARTCGGTDCNDTDAAIRPDATEICDNGVDDDCDGLNDIEETECAPTNDTCETAEDITPATLGTFRYRRSTLTFDNDIELTCTGTTTDTRRDGPDAMFVLRLEEPRDVTLRIEGLGYNGGLMLRERSACASGPNLKCSAPSSSTLEPVIHRRAMPAGEYVIVVKTREPNIFTLAVTLEAASSAQADICTADAVDVSAGGTFTGPLLDDDYDVSCRTSTSSYPEAAHRLIVPAGEFRDVRLTATTRTSSGSSSTPHVELTSECGNSEPAFTECASGTTSVAGELLVRGLPAGTYYVLVENTSTAVGGTYTLVADVMPSAGREAGDSCDPGVPVPVTTTAPGTIELAALDATRDEGEFCSANRAGYRDAFFTFTLAAEQDVVVHTMSTARHWVGVSSSCGVVSSALDCMASASGQATRRFLRVPAGTHYLNVSTLADAGAITASIETFAPTPLPPNDACAGAIPLVDGTPTDVDLPQYSDDEPFSCGGAGSLDAYYSFTLTSPRFVTLRAEGARSMAVLRGSCGSTPAFCVTGGPPQVTQVLEADTYYVAVETPALEAMSVRLRFNTADP